MLLFRVISCQRFGAVVCLLSSQPWLNVLVSHFSWKIMNMAVFLTWMNDSCHTHTHALNWPISARSSWPDLILLAMFSPVLNRWYITETKFVMHGGGSVGFVLHGSESAVPWNVCIDVINCYRNLHSLSKEHGEAMYFNVCHFSICILLYVFLSSKIKYIQLCMVKFRVSTLTLLI